MSGPAIGFEAIVVSRLRHQNSNGIRAYIRRPPNIPFLIDHHLSRVLAGTLIIPVVLLHPCGCGLPGLGAYLHGLLDVFVLLPFLDRHLSIDSWLELIQTGVDPSLSALAPSPVE